MLIKIRDKVVVPDWFQITEISSRTGGRTRSLALGGQFLPVEQVRSARYRD
jgi:hypothetical protein